ncbi:MAG: glycosyltransferase family 4 protein [candidate division WWE3 bacterium]|nr:glycosyltransferase family 4 protein [candidate division WWE3 bacterium]
MSAMKILFITEFFAPHKGGSELYAQELLTALKRSHPDTVIEILCYNTQKVSPVENINGIRVFRVPCFGVLKDQFYLPNPLKLISILKKLSRNNYDVVVSQVRFFDPAWWSWIYARLISARSVFIEHGSGFVEHPSRLVRFISRLIDRTVVPFSLRHYGKVVVISRASQKFVQQKLGVKETTLVYGGVDTSIFSARRSKAQRILPKTSKIIAKDALVVTFVGRLIWAKGPQVLLKSFASFLHRNPSSKAVLVLGGEGPLMGELKDRVKKSRLEENVIFLGSLSKAEVAQLLSVTDVFVNPSFNEGLPRTVIEAGAAGRFVIATDVGATREIVEDRRTGLLVPKASEEALSAALAWFASHRKEARNMARLLAQKTSSTFSWEVVSREFWAKVLSSHSSVAIS